jgi:predicted RNA-binding protein YlxR (DUF448 family)
MPIRTCIACRQKEQQANLFRISMIRDGEVGLWLGSGRSAYVCRRPECVTAAMSKGKLERALKGHVSTESRQALITELECKLR